MLGLTSALLCGVAIGAQHGLATAMFAALTASIGLIAVLLRRSQ